MVAVVEVVLVVVVVVVVEMMAVKEAKAHGFIPSSAYRTLER